MHDILKKEEETWHAAAIATQEHEARTITSQSLPAPTAHHN